MTIVADTLPEHPYASHREVRSLSAPNIPMKRPNAHPTVTFTPSMELELVCDGSSVYIAPRPGHGEDPSPLNTHIYVVEEYPQATMNFDKVRDSSNQPPPSLLPI